MIDRIHDTIGESGYSPYEIVFGRQRPLASLPYEPVHESEDALTFFARQEKIDKEISRVLQEKHKKREDWLNAKRNDPPPFKVGDLVWYLRPPNSGNKLDSRWLGPAAVVRRDNDRSYEIELKPQYFIKAPRNLLKAYVEDRVVGRPTELFVHRRTEPGDDLLPDEWNVEKILDHKIEKGQYKFLTQWEGSDEKTWEPVGNFIHRYSVDFVKYCKKLGILTELLQFLTAA